MAKDVKIQEKLEILFGKETLTEKGFKSGKAEAGETGYFSYGNKYYLRDKAKIRGPFSANGLILATGILIFDDREKVKDYDKYVDEMSCKEFASEKELKASLQAYHSLELFTVIAMTLLLFVTAFLIIKPVDSMWFTRVFLRRHLIYTGIWALFLAWDILLICKLKVEKRFLLDRPIQHVLFVILIPLVFIVMSISNIKDWQAVDAKNWNYFLEENKKFEEKFQDEDWETYYSLKSRIAAAFANELYGTNYDIDNLKPLYDEYMAHPGRDKKLMLFASYVFQDNHFFYNNENYSIQKNAYMGVDGIGDLKIFVNDYLKDQGLAQYDYNSWDGVKNAAPEELAAAMKAYLGPDGDRYRVNYFMASLCDKEEGIGDMAQAFTNADKLLIYERFYACAQHEINYHTENNEERIFINNYWEFGGDGYGVDNLMADYETFTQTGETGDTLDQFMRSYYYSSGNDYQYSLQVTAKDWVNEHSGQIAEDAQKSGISLDSDPLDYEALRKLCDKYKDDLF